MSYMQMVKPPFKFFHKNMSEITLLMLLLTWKTAASHATSRRCVMIPIYLTLSVAFSVLQYRAYSGVGSTLMVCLVEGKDKGIEWNRLITRLSLFLFYGKTNPLFFPLENIWISPVRFSVSPTNGSMVA